MHADKRESVAYSHIHLAGFNWWSGRGKSTWIKGTVSRYSHFHLTGFNWWSGRGTGKQIIGTVSRFSNFRSWLQKRGKGTRIKGTVSRCSHFHYKLASTGAWSDRRKGTRIKGTVSQIHISIKLVSTGGQEGRKTRGLKGQWHDIQIFITNWLQLVVGRGKGMHGFKRQCNDRHIFDRVRRKLP